jgi:hypothetical protein
MSCPLTKGCLSFSLCLKESTVNIAIGVVTAKRNTASLALREIHRTSANISVTFHQRGIRASIVSRAEVA